MKPSKKTILKRRGIAAGAFFVLCAGIAQSDTGFTTGVQPFLAKNCHTCHSAKLSTAGLNLEIYKDSTTLEKNRDLWEQVLSKIESGEMPPAGIPRPDPAASKAVTDWLQAEFKRQDKLVKPDPGHITSRRLNRAEYNNTVRDLLGVDFHPADDFPQDDSGYGFDNIGDVLSLSPGLMEKYLTAAEKITRAALYGDDAVKPTMVHYQPHLRRPPPPPTYAGYDETGLSLPSSFNGLHRFPVKAEYLFKITLNGARPNGSDPVTLAAWVDGKQIQQFTIEPPNMEGESRQFRIRIAKGERLVSVSFLKAFEGLPANFNGPNPSKKEPAAKRRGSGAVPAAGAIPNVSVAGRVEALDIGGPFDAKPEPPTTSLAKILICGHLDGRHNDSCPRKILSDVALRAYRRPVAPAEVDSLVRLYGKVRAKGDSFNEGIAVPIQYILSSPDFLFRIEGNSKTGTGVRPISQFELATRLSYFLWSSMPDEALYRSARQGKLRQPAELEAQVRRMLKDPKAEALVDNFAGQWLLLRNIDLVKPDWERFLFDDLLRTSMKRETELFLSNIIHEDLSIIDIIGAKYTYLNERLARFYGIQGVTGPEFRKVDLTGNPQRGGLLTHASVLTVSSYATRTSPVLRGKWILENILNTPPPPPPPVPDLEVAGVGVSVSLRQQLEKHRADPGCAGCHARMDPLGFGLENYNAIGEWRTEDGKFAIDSTGKLPDGRTFEGPEGLKAVILSNQNAFARAVTEKLLTYALGRGLERFDKPVIEGIVNQAIADKYRFSSVVLGIVRSMPFGMIKSERPKLAKKKGVKMFVTRKHLSRRTLLRGLGTAIALPYLDAMMPAFGAPASSAPTAAKATRLAFVYIPNGVVMKDWTPQTAGAGWESTPILKSLEPYRKDMFVLTGLADHNGNALGDGGGDHARAAASFLTGVHPFKTAGSDIRSGISADQIVAKHMAKTTRLSSLELGCDDSRIVGSCDTGYSCAYTNNISWRGPASPMPPETNPRLVFERLFGTEDYSLDPATRARRAEYRKSILDMARERTSKIMGDLGPSDRRKVDEYLYAIREIEKRIVNAENDNQSVAPAIEKPSGIPIAFADYMKLMYDLQVIAFQADLTRVTTLMVGREGSVRVYPEVNVSDPHHPLSHHLNNPESLTKLSRINTLHAELVSYFIGKLKSTQDGDGTLLDHSMIVYGGGISDSNRHLHENLPILLFGRGDGSLKPGRHVVYEKQVPMTNLYLSLMDRMGVKPESVGDSNGMVEHLTEL